MELANGLSSAETNTTFTRKVQAFCLDLNGNRLSKDDDSFSNHVIALKLKTDIRTNYGSKSPFSNPYKHTCPFTTTLMYASDLTTAPSYMTLNEFRHNIDILGTTNADYPSDAASLASKPTASIEYRMYAKIDGSTHTYQN